MMYIAFCTLVAGWSEPALLLPPDAGKCVKGSNLPQLASHLILLQSIFCAVTCTFNLSQMDWIN